MLGWPAAEDVDWGILFHAYGPAHETPAHLRALTGDDHKAQLDAMDHLFYEVLHQGTVYPATAVVVRVVSGLLGDVQLRRQGADGQSLLADVLDFLDGAAEQAVLCPVENADGAPTGLELTRRQVGGYFTALKEGEDIKPFLPVINALWRAGMADLQAAAGEVYRAVEPFLRDTDNAVRIRTVGLLTRLVQLPAAAENRDSLRSDLLSRAHVITDRNELASAVLGLAELGADPASWLADPDPAIRACAALPLHDNPEATRVLLAALREPESVDSWFSDPPRWFPYAVRETLLSELLSRDVNFEDVLPLVPAIVPLAQGRNVERDWGLLLLKAFPGVDYNPGVPPPPPTTLSEAQRALLQALVDNDSLWDPTNANANMARMRVGIPNSQDEVRDLIARAG